MMSGFWWSTDEVNLVVSMYEEGKSLDYICYRHNRLYPARSYSAIRSEIYSNAHTRRTHVFTPEEKAWVKENMDLRTPEAYRRFREVFGDINKESLRYRMYRERRERKMREERHE